MTKEELKKEAYLYAENSKDVQNFECGFDIAFKSYLASAEPREKRIAELEDKLEQTEKDLADYQFNYPTIKELQKENAELKARVNEQSERISELTQELDDKINRFG